MFCGCPSDSPDDERLEKLTRKQIRDGIRLDHLRDHYMKKHKRDAPSEGRSLLDMGFTRAGGSGAAGLSTNAEMEIEESASLRLNMEQPDESVAAHTEQRLLGPALPRPTPVAIAEIGMPSGHAFQSLVSKTLDTVIKTNVNAGVIASKESVS
jgi:hypothetical protein